MTVHLTEFCPKSAIVLDFSGDISGLKLFAVFRNVNTPFCKLSSKSAIMT